MEKLYSDKLKEAMAEIKAVISRHDVAAHVLLFESHLSEYLLRIDPSWSVMRLEDEGIRFRSQLSEFDGDKVAQKLATELSIGMLRHFSDLLMRDILLFEKLLAMLGEKFDIDHTGATHTPHREH